MGVSRWLACCLLCTLPINSSARNKGTLMFLTKLSHRKYNFRLANPNLLTFSFSVDNNSFVTHNGNNSATYIISKKLLLLCNGNSLSRKLSLLLLFTNLFETIHVAIYFFLMKQHVSYFLHCSRNISGKGERRLSSPLAKDS